MTDTVAAAPSQDALAQVLIELVREVIPHKARHGLQITPDMELADLGITSMSKISLAFKLEERLGIDVSHLGEAMADVRTVRDVIGLVAGVGVR